MLHHQKPKGMWCWICNFFWGLRTCISIFVCVSVSPQTWSAWCTAASGQKSKTRMGAAQVTPKWQTTLKDRRPPPMPQRILGVTATWCPPNNRRTDRWTQAGRRGSYPWKTHGQRRRRTDRAAVETQRPVGRGQSRRHRAPSPASPSWGRDICRRV